MAKKLNGIVLEIGADSTKLTDALKDVNKNASALQSELREVDRALKFNPDNVELVAQKQKILTDIIANTGDKLDILRNAQEQVNRQFQDGQIGEDVFRAFQREIIETESKLNHFDSQLNQTEDAVEDVGDSAEKSGDGFTVMKGAMSDIVSNGIQTCLGAVKDLVGSLFELGEATEEYRSMQAKLEGSAQNFGYEADFAKSKYEELYKYLGDDQMATNAVTNLLGLGTTTENVSSLLDGAIGVWASYGDSIPIESLTEAINETIQVGKVTGTFADTLNWAGVSEDEFNKKLESLSSTEERANAVAEFLNETYSTSKDTYDELSESVLDANEAELDMKETQADLAETIAPLNNAMQELKAKALEAVAPLVEDLVNGFMDMYESMKQNPETMQALADVGETLANAFKFLGDVLSEVFGFIVESLKYLWDNCEEFRGNLTDAVGILTRAIVVIVEPFLVLIKGLIQTALDVIMGVVKIFSGLLTGDWQLLWNGILQIATSILVGIKNFVINALDFIIAFIVSRGTLLWNAGKSIFTALWNGIKFIWESMVKFFTETVPNKFEELGDIDLLQVGKDIFNSLWDGLKSIWTDISGWFEEKVSWISSKLSWITGKKAEAEAEATSIELPTSRLNKVTKQTLYDGQHANGLSYVPYDGYIAQLHKGERVLTAKESQAYTNGAGGGGLNVVQNIYVPTSNPRELERQAKRNLVKLGLGVS